MAPMKMALADHVSWRRIDNKAVLLNLASSEYYTFNATGCRLLELISESKSLEEMAECLSVEFDVTPGAALADVRRFLSRLQDNDLARRA